MTNITDSGEIMKSKSAVALGIFDGVHIGHREIISAALEYKKSNLSPVVFTFNVESIEIKHGRKYEYIYDDRQKHEILDSLGVEYIFSPDAEQLKNMSGEEFSEKILAERLNAEAVICGENFRFGKNAVCGADELIRFGEKFGFEVKVVELLRRDGKIISSEAVRNMLVEGKIPELRENWGIRYFINSVVKEGNRIGSTVLSFPTVNQHFSENQLVPRKGVYCSVTEIGGVEYCSITNVGYRPTVADGAAPLAETHILDYSGDLYGKRVKVTLLYFIRDEMKFESLEDLKKQIDADIASVRKRSAKENVRQVAGKD